LDGKIQDKIRDFRSSESLAGNPLFSHPATKPIIESIKSQLSSKYPEASPQDIAKQTEQMLQAFVDTAKGTETPESKDSKLDQDWSDFLK
jgi:hypothetical protein